uniref:ShKT domain-containing protein n=1 Tax=Panagrellus redivivus TaxID=6233 RepID=A0A7E5A1T8_PANRE
MRLPRKLQFFGVLFAVLIQISLSIGDDDPVRRNFKCRLNGCCDQHEWCRFWATMGECRTNLRWMSNNCQLACGTCNKAPVTRNQLQQQQQQQQPLAPPPTIAPPRQTAPPGTAPPPITRRPAPPIPVPQPRRNNVRQPPVQQRVQQRQQVTPAPVRIPQTAATFAPPPNTAPPPPAPGSALARCRQIQADPSLAAEVLLREKLVFPTEGEFICD